MRRRENGMIVEDLTLNINENDKSGLMVMI